MKVEVTKELVKKLEELALVELSEEEEERIKDDLQKILQFFNKIDELDLSNIEPLFHPIGSSKLRPDEPIMGLSKDEALLNVKRKQEEGYIIGPRTYGE
ncbi:MAG: Asp-tRNA(Asn) amidotransferase subunit GatC [Sulfolobaceae archaeon]